MNREEFTHRSQKRTLRNQKYHSSFVVGRQLDLSWVEFCNRANLENTGLLLELGLSKHGTLQKIQIHHSRQSSLKSLACQFISILTHPLAIQRITLSQTLSSPWPNWHLTPQLQYPLPQYPLHLRLRSYLLTGIWTSSCLPWANRHLSPQLQQPSSEQVLHSSVLCLRGLVLEKFGSYQISSELSHSVRAYSISMQDTALIYDFLYFQMFIQSLFQFSIYLCYLLIHNQRFTRYSPHSTLPNPSSTRLRLPIVLISLNFAYETLWRQYYKFLSPDIIIGFSFAPEKSMLHFAILIFSQTCFIILSMDPYKSSLKSSLKAAAFKNSYIGGFHNPQAIKKSKMQLESIQESAIDDKTFKIMNDFPKPTENISIYRQTGRCYLEPSSIFSCFSTRKAYQFVLNNSKFLVRSAEKIVRFVDFNVVWASVDTKGDGLVFTFEGCTSRFYLELMGPKKQQDTSKLLQNMNDLIKQTDGRAKQLTYLALKSPLDFFKTQHVQNAEFQRSANSCDLLLFKSQHSAATVQRVFTDSEYDHVGLVLRNKKNELFIYESTSDTGVGLTSWKQFVKYEWYTQIDKICWRQLDIKLNSADIDLIEKFVVKTLGKQFQLNLQKLLTFKSSLQRTEDEQQNKTYFCSELVARLYKELGIFSSEKSSTSYFPVDFSDKGSLKIIREGVSLSNQKLLAFDKIS